MQQTGATAAIMSENYPQDHSEQVVKTLIQAGYRYACALNSDVGEARALVHEAWLKLRNRHGNAPDLPLFYRTIRHLHIDNYRRSQRVSFSATDDQGLAAGEQMDALDVSEVPDRALQLALMGLREREREALFLSVVEGYTASEISQIMDCPRGTVLSLVHRARTSLKQALTYDQNTAARNDARVLPFRSRLGQGTP